MAKGRHRTETPGAITRMAGPATGMVAIHTALDLALDRRRLTTGTVGRLPFMVIRPHMRPRCHGQRRRFSHHRRRRTKSVGYRSRGHGFSTTHRSSGPSEAPRLPLANLTRPWQPLGVRIKGAAIPDLPIAAAPVAKRVVNRAIHNSNKALSLSLVRVGCIFWRPKSCPPANSIRSVPYGPLPAPTW
jgi:hypothetical protein